MQQLHDSEINAGVETFYDAGMRVWLSDTINGIKPRHRSSQLATNGPPASLRRAGCMLKRCGSIPRAIMPRRPRRRRGHAEATEDFAIMSDGPASASSAGKPSST
jgi:hypothetical protein